MSLSKSKCWYSNYCLQFLKHAVPLKQKGHTILDTYEGKQLSYAARGV
jgi:hypothetical protein